VEFGDLKWHTAEIVYMLLGIEWQGVPRRNYLRVWRRMEENRALLAMMRLLVVASVSAVGMSDRQVQ
jgi:hypothetical protein